MDPRRNQTQTHRRSRHRNRRHIHRYHLDGPQLSLNAKGWVTQRIVSLSEFHVMIAKYCRWDIT